MILLKNDPFLPSGSKNYIHGAIENVSNRAKLRNLQLDENVSQDEIIKFVSATNKNMLKRYDYDEYFKNEHDFKDF
jgi:hypothetical protein